MVVIRKCLKWCISDCDGKYIIMIPKYLKRFFGDYDDERMTVVMTSQEWLYLTFVLSSPAGIYTW